MAKRDSSTHAAALLAGILAWIVPGAGHVYLGRTLRGVILFLCVNGLFWAGVAFGGVFTVEPLRERWWFAAQMATGASGLGSWYLQGRFRRAIASEAGLAESTPPADPAGAQAWWEKYERAVAEKGLALVYPTDSVARAYSGIAGMLNLLCIFDAVMLGLLGRYGEPAPQPPGGNASRKEPPG